ncbi:MAG: hypothetical protein ACREBS_08930, partial [Nitrososphaerales archaeon]
GSFPMTVSVAKGTSPGNYTGTVEVEFSEGGSGQLVMVQAPATVEVLPISTTTTHLSLTRLARGPSWQWWLMIILLIAATIGAAIAIRRKGS